MVWKHFEQTVGYYDYVTVRYGRVVLLTCFEKKKNSPRTITFSLSVFLFSFQSYSSPFSRTFILSVVLFLLSYFFPLSRTFSEWYFVSLSRTFFPLNHTGICKTGLMVTKDNTKHPTPVCQSKGVFSSSVIFG